jgi:hypothetical protein
VPRLHDAYDLLNRSVVGVLVLERVEPVEDGDEACLVAAVDLDHALVAGRPGAADQLACALELLFEDGPEAGVGEERVAGQAGIGVRAVELQRQPAVSVRERLLGASDPLLEQNRVVGDVIGQDRDPLARMLTRCW